MTTRRGFAVAAILPIWAVWLAAQVPSTAPKKTSGWTQPRTADGQPDIQGIWSNASNKPLERPKELGAKEFYTEAEFAVLAQKGFLGERNAQPEAHYDFSQYGMDAMQAKFAPNLRTSIVVGPEGRIPPMTPEAVKRNAARAARAKGHEFDGPENRSVMERCIVYGQLEGPPMLPPMYNNNMEIVQGPGYVAILNEMYHDVRMIPVDGRPHVPPAIRQWRGDPRGHWEGNTLVVNNTNFTDKTPFHGSSEKLHVVERFTRTSAETVVYQFTVEDPATWEKPWSGELVMGPALGEIFEFACHEGNYGLPNNLSGARAEEKRTAPDAAKPAPFEKPSSWTQPRTPDGQPDLEGVWTNASSIPMERPKNLGAKEFYTEEEAAELAKKGYQGDRAPLPEAHYDMSQFGIDPMQAKFAPNLRTSLIVGPEGRIPAMLPEAQKRNAARAAKAKGHDFDSAQNRPLQERCILWAAEGPPMLATTYNNNLEIVQGPGYVAILNEMIHDARVIPLDGRPHVSKDIRLWRGDSRGHWEGNTLVVDTTNFTDQTPFRGSSENLHVVERFTRTSQDLIVYEFTVDDPSTWVKPWTAQLTMGPAPGEVFEYACHEGNRGLANGLSAARAEEAKEGK